MKTYLEGTVIIIIILAEPSVKMRHFCQTKRQHNGIAVLKGVSRAAISLSFPEICLFCSSLSR